MFHIGLRRLFDRPLFGLLIAETKVLTNRLDGSGAYIDGPSVGVLMGGSRLEHLTGELLLVAAKCDGPLNAPLEFSDIVVGPVILLEIGHGGRLYSFDIPTRFIVVLLQNNRKEAVYRLFVPAMEGLGFQALSR